MEEKRGHLPYSKRERLETGLNGDGPKERDG